jgi:peptidoglycan/LPS O-acetylase OafA/YrhL
MMLALIVFLAAIIAAWLVWYGVESRRRPRLERNAATIERLRAEARARLSGDA